MFFGHDITQHLTGELELVTARLHEQYTQNFVGPGAHTPLYASIYCDNNGQLWGDSTVWVKKFIEAAALSFNDNWDSIPDHISIELELMQRLCAYEAQQWAQSASAPSDDDKENFNRQLSLCLEAEGQFLREHLSVWIPQFCERVLEISVSVFYREMAKLTKSVVLCDAEQVEAAQAAL